MLAHSDNEGLCEELGPQWAMDHNTGQPRWIEVEEIKTKGLMMIFNLPIIKGPQTGIVLPLIEKDFLDSLEKL